jgi:hypothetical protein
MPAPRALYRLAASVLVLSLLVGIAAGCASAPAPEKVDPTIDELIEIAIETPAYGGVRVVRGDPEQASAWTVFLFDESEEAAARFVLWNVLGPRGGLVNIEIRPKQKQVEPDIVDRVGDTLLAIDGVNGAGYGGPGHLVVDVTKVPAISRVQNVLPSLDVPFEAVIIKASGQPVLYGAGQDVIPR